MSEMLGKPTHQGRLAHPGRLRAVAGWSMGSLAKKLFLGELERRFCEPLLYPPQSRRLALSQIVLEQARWLGRCLVSSNLEYEAMELR
ncbi:hypothetical protein NW855_02910 [Synechococcus sp. RC10B2]|uniref:hypothetical protein n=2 Tax=Synechococcus TaxID=1129 RepID=UPI0039C637D5